MTKQDQKRRQLILVLGDQLTIDTSSLHDADKERDTISSRPVTKPTPITFSDSW